jgi:DNA invertase Pin-like site-specific DNA recombinase
MATAVEPSPVALVYVRQSQDSKASKDQQQAAGLVRAQEEAWAVQDVYRDGSSASRHATKTRADWTRLLADLELPQVGVLWLWESSRGDRTLTSWSALLDRCRERGVRIYVETHERLYNMANPRDWKTLAEDGVDSAYEVDKTALRIRRSVAAKAKEGQVHGRTPYGYRRRYGLDEKGKRVILGQFPDPDEAKVVKGIFDGIQRGQSLRSMAADLNARGVPTVTGTAWTPQRLRDIALAPVYAGKRQHEPGSRSGHVRRNREVHIYDGTWDGIVTVEQFNGVHRLLTDPRRRTSRPGRAKHLLSMIATCGVCGGVLIARFDHGREGTYICRDRSCVRVPMDELDDFVQGLLLTRLANKREYRHLAEGDGVVAQVQAARDEVAEIQAHYDELLNLTRARRMTATAFADMEPGVLADLARASTRLAGLETPSQLRVLLGDLDDGRDVAARWKAATPVARRTLVRLLCAGITVQRAPTPGHHGPVADRVNVVSRRTDAAA